MEVLPFAPTHNNVLILIYGGTEVYSPQSLHTSVLQTSILFMPKFASICSIEGYLLIGLLRVSEYSDIRGSKYKIGYEYSSLPRSLDRDLFFFFFFDN